MTSRLLDRVGGAVATPEDGVSALSDRELQVFEMIGRGLGTGEIALRLDISVKTVESHRQKIKLKLNLRTGAELTRYATPWVLQSPP